MAARDRQAGLGLGRGLCKNVAMTDRQPTRNIKLVVAYNGAAYHGWQRQQRHIDTVQQRLEDALVGVVKHPVAVCGASRTDAGVHAAGQVAGFETTATNIPPEGLRRAVNSRLPDDIIVRSARVVGKNFHASRLAVGKTYRYRIYTSPSRPVMLAGQVWHYWRPLEVEPMRRGAHRLAGRRDFRAFATSAEQRENTVRTITACTASRLGSEIRITVTGNGFLYNMVRNIVGTLVEIGRGRWSPERIDEILASRDRAMAGPTAPPDGLYLLCVHY